MLRKLEICFVISLQPDYQGFGFGKNISNLILENIKIMVKRAILLLIVFSAVFSGCKKDEEVPRTNIYIGAMLPLTGAGASVGESAYAAIQLAVEDIQASLISRGIQANVAVFIEDTETDPDVAAQKISSFANLGVNICIGPYSSSNVSAVKSYADNNELLIVSPASVSTSLAIAGDNIFRLVPSDEKQAEAISALLEDDGIEVLIPIIRDDLWGNELLAANTQEFMQNNGQVEDAVKYSTSVDDYTPYLNSLKELLVNSLEQFPPEKIGVYIVAYGESVELLNLAAQDSIFGQVKWYGSSGFAGIQNLPADTVAAEFAESRDLSCPSFGFDPTVQDKWEPLLERLENLLERQPEIYAFATYDAVWLAVETYLATGETIDFNTIKQTFEFKADNTQGVTGVAALNADGDRAYATYDFWGIQHQAEQYNWVTVARYNNETGTLERY